MKPLTALAFLFIVAVPLLMLNSCKQDNAPDDSLSAEDYVNIYNSLDLTSDDIVSAAGQANAISGKTESWQALCGVASLDSSTANQIVITYNGATACKGIVRSGVVSISLVSGLLWRLQNAVLAITYNNLTFTNSATGAYYIMNGTDTITNETGGLAREILEGIEANISVRHRQKSTNLNVTFTDGTQRIWSQDRSKIYSSKVTGTQNVITLTDFSENAGNIEIWGITRTGDNFTNAIIDSVKTNDYNASCLWKPYVGEDLQKIANRTVDILYGIDGNGNPIGKTTACPYGYKITYSKGKKILTKIIAYNF